ncbi:MAG: VCBS domain-containing protein, partial [Sideroxydans sp.]|nr:VCBS domain-containing protein [Sideroxydans sp.]
NPTVQALGAGSTLNETYTVTAIDGTTSTVKITVNGTNDAAVISTATANLTETNAVLTTSGALTISDVDSPATFVAGTIAGTYGSVVIDAAGNWVYTASSAHDEFAAGTTYSDVFTVSSADGTTSTITVNILGTNDAAVLSTATANLTETNAVLTTSGALTISDVDSPATFVAGTIAGTYGSVAIDAAGNWVYTASSAHDEFVAGTTYSDVFTVTSADGTTSTITVNILGTNDAAVISSANTIGVDAGAVTEDTTLTASGMLTISDADAGQAAFQPQTNTVGTYGSFSLNAAGAWTFSLNNTLPAVQALKTGETLSETYTVTALDGTTSTVKITVNGLNETTSGGVSAVQEDFTLSTGGTLTTTGGGSFFVPATTTGGYGTLVMGADGAWTYTLDNASPAVQGLAANQTAQENFVVNLADGSTTSVIITVTGTNDAAVISSANTIGVDAGSVTEDTALNTSGTLTISDADVGQAAFQPQSATIGAYGTFTLDAAGNWTFALNNALPAVQALGVGQTLSETYTVTSLDGTQSTVKITVNGTNDAAVISSANTIGVDAGAVTEDTVLSTSGTLTITDTDAGQAAFQPQTSTVGTYGSFSLNAAGAWTFVLNNSNAAVQALGVGQTLTENYTVTAVDGTTSTVKITVNGTNDAAVISSASVVGVDAGAVTEDTVLSTSGTLTITDTDAGQALFQAQTGTVGNYGSFTLDAAGNWTFALNNSLPAVQALGAGQTLSETYTVTSVDGTTSTVKITVNGTNDAAVISSANTIGVDAGAVTEDTVLSASGTLTISDTDAGQAAFQAQVGTVGAYGTFTLDAAGNWTFALNNALPAVQTLAIGQTLSETYTVTALDGTQSTVKITVNGINETATTGVGAVQEDTTLSSGGILTVTGGATFVPATTAGGYGSLVVAADGTWTYTLNNTDPAVQALAANQSVQENFSVTLSDGSTTSIVVTVAGTNDAAVISNANQIGVDVGAVTEDTVLNTSGTLTITDVDAGQAAFQAQAGTVGAYGSFTLDAAGNWTFALNNSLPVVQALGAGQTLTENYTVTAVDGTQSTVKITVNGTNDAPVISSANTIGVDAGAVTEDTVLSTSGTLTITDTDAGQAGFQAQ